jgi:hypothetical protein
MKTLGSLSYFDSCCGRNNPESHVKALMGKLECSDESSLQNALDLVHGYLNQIPSYGHREVLILYSALSTCDPGDIMETIQKCKKSKIRCSVIGLSAEIFICKHLCQAGGSYSVALDGVRSINYWMFTDQDCYLDKTILPKVVKMTT